MNQLYHWGDQFTRFFNFKNKNIVDGHDIVGSSVGNQAKTTNRKENIMDEYNDLELIGKAVSFKHPLSGNVHVGLVCRANKGNVDVRIEKGDGSHDILQQLNVGILTFIGQQPVPREASYSDVAEEETSSLNVEDYAELAPKRRGRKPLILEGLALLPAGRKEFSQENFTSGMFYILDVDNSKTGGPSVVAVKTDSAQGGWDVGASVKICHSRGHKNLPPSVVKAAFAPGDEIDEQYTKKMAHWPQA